jgi:hypothetical protein
MPLPYDPSPSPIDPETFRGKLYLLIIDKLIIGAIIAAAFVAYDAWKTAELSRLDREKAEQARRLDHEKAEQARRLETQARQITTEFERAKLVKELLPIIASHHESIDTRAYALRSALQTGSLDSESGVELTSNLIADGLGEESFNRIMAIAMPDCLPAICRRIYVLVHKDRTRAFDAGAPLFTATDSRERELWCASVKQALPRLESYAPLERSEDLSQLLLGLSFALSTVTYSEAVDLSRHPSRGVALCGYIRRLEIRDDRVATDKIGEQLLLAPTMAEVKLDKAVLVLLKGFQNGPVQVPIARLACTVPMPESAQLSLREAQMSLRFFAATLLVSMGKRTRAAGSNDRNEAEPIILQYLSRLRHDLENASSPEQLKQVATPYEDDKIAVNLVNALSEPLSDSARGELRRIMDLGEDKLRPLPILSQFIAKALADSP